MSLVWTWWPSLSPSPPPTPLLLPIHYRHSKLDTGTRHVPSRKSNNCPLKFSPYIYRIYGCFTSLTVYLCAVLLQEDWWYAGVLAFIITFYAIIGLPLPLHCTEYISVFARAPHRAASWLFLGFLLLRVTILFLIHYSWPSSPSFDGFSCLSSQVFPCHSASRVSFPLMQHLFASCLCSIHTGTACSGSA